MDSLRREYGPLDKLRVWFGNRSVIVFTMGKVGTLTVCNSLRAIGYKHVHPHSLRYTRPGIHFLKVKLSWLSIAKYSFKTILKRIKVWLWKALKREIIIVSGVRDPFSRNVSAYFEQVHYLGGIEEGRSYEEIVDQFEAHCEFLAPLDWFDSEMLPLTGIDIFEHPFDVVKGFAEIKKGKFRIFLFRIDKLNDLESELGSFIKDDRFRIVSTNRSTDGRYKRQLQEFKEKYKYPQSMVDAYSMSKYMRHFYSTDETEKFAQRWASGS